MKRVWIALAAVLVVLLPARLYDTLVLSNAVTGLYAAGSVRQAYAVFVAVVVAAAVLLSLGGRLKVRAEAGSGLQSAGAAVLAALTGLFVAGQSLASLVVPAKESNRGMEIVFSVFGLLAAAAFLTAAYDFASGGGLLNEHPLVGLLPAVWGCLGLISMFVNYAATVNSLANVYNTFTVALLLLFLFSQAKFLAGMEREKSGARMMRYGPAGAATALLTSVPDCVRYFSGKAELGLFPVGMHLFNIVLAVYILVYLSAVFNAPEILPIQEAAVQADANSPQAAAPDLPEKEPIGEDTVDLLQQCSEFLKNFYQATEKFVEYREISAAIPGNGKS